MIEKLKRDNEKMREALEKIVNNAPDLEPTGNTPCIKAQSIVYSYWYAAQLALQVLEEVKKDS